MFQGFMEITNLSLSDLTISVCMNTMSTAGTNPSRTYPHGASESVTWQPGGEQEGLPVSPRRYGFPTLSRSSAWTSPPPSPAPKRITSSLLSAEMDASWQARA